MYVVFFIFIFIILLLSIPFYFKICVDFSINNRTGMIIIKLFNIKIIDYTLIYKNRKILLYNKKNIQKLDFDIDKEHLTFVNQLKTEIFKRIFLSKFLVTLKVGIKDNPFLLALITGLIQMFLNILFGAISFQKPTSKLGYDLNTYYNLNVGILNIEICLAISILNFLLAIIKAKKSINNKQEVHKIEIKSRAH